MGGNFTADFIKAEASVFIEANASTERARFAGRSPFPLSVGFRVSIIFFIFYT